jgi:cation:H+ antiporter
MMLLIHIFIFLASCSILAFSSKVLVNILLKIASFLKLKEFVVSFFLMAFAVSLPNFLVGIVSAIKKIPELSFGDVIGGNIVDLSLVMGLAALLSRGGLSAQSRTVQGSSIFTIFIGVLPLFLIFDHQLSRPDGILLILSFFLYIGWLFSKKDRFTKVYEEEINSKNFKNFLKNLFALILSAFFCVLSSKEIVRSAIIFSKALNLPLTLIGLFIVGLGNSLPETFFSIQAARKGQDWMVLGDLMGGVVITATLVLGIVALISPIKIVDFSPFAIARFFLVVSSLFFFLFVRTDRKITKKEAIFLLSIYILFLLVEILFNRTQTFLVL